MSEWGCEKDVILQLPESGILTEKRSFQIPVGHS